MNYRTKKGIELFQSKVDSYFEDCDKENIGCSKLSKPYTMSGLLFHLNITEEELDDLCESRKLNKIITNAKLKIESYIEENALNGKLSGTAAINSLKCNFGWNDKADKDSPCRNFSVILEGDADELGL